MLKHSTDHDGFQLLRVDTCAIFSDQAAKNVQSVARGIFLRDGEVDPAVLQGRLWREEWLCFARTARLSLHIPLQTGFSCWLAIGAHEHQMVIDQPESFLVND